MSSTRTEPTSDTRPSTVAAKEEFSSWGRRHVILLRGKWGLAIDRAFMRLTGYSLVSKQYSVAGRLPYQPSLMLTTIGARTGQLRTTVLPYYAVGDRRIVVGSNGGGPTDPGWVHNVRANPATWVRVGWRKRPMRAHVAQGREREELFAELSRRRPSIPRYQESCAPRELPLVVLEPIGPNGSA